jgi:hypothetical protein
LSGVFGALACWCKQPAVFSVLFSLIIVINRIRQFRGPDHFIRDVIIAVLIWLAGGVSVSLLIAAYFASHGILGEFLYWSFQHSMLYSSEALVFDRLMLAWHGLMRVVINSPLLFVLAICAVFLKHDRLVLTAALLAGFFALSLLGASIGFAYPHYFAQLIPPLVILAGLSGNTIINKLVHERARHIVSAALLCAVILAAVLPNSHYHLSGEQESFSRQFFGISPFPESVSMASYLKENTEPGDRIFIYGSEPQILLMAERTSATAFYVLYPLFRSEIPRYLEFQERAMEEIEESRPKYIISVLLPASLNYDGRAELKISDYLRDYVSKHYQVENSLLFSEEKNSWLSEQHEYFRTGGKRSDVSIVFHRRTDG